MSAAGTTPRVPAIRTRVARMVDEDHRFWGHSVSHELMSRIPLSGLLAMSVTGRWLSAEECAVLDDIAVALTAADPRVWPLKLGRLVAAFGHAVPALAAVQLGLAGENVGPQAVGATSRLLVDVAEELGQRRGDDGAIEALVRRRLESGERLPGFGVPFRPFDERLVAFRRSLERRGRLHLPYSHLAEKTAEVVHAVKGLGANAALGIAAALLDIGCTPDQASFLTFGLMLPNYAAITFEGARQAEPQLRRLPDDAVEYLGPPPRRSPRAEEAEGKR